MAPPRNTLRPPEWSAARDGPRSAASLTFELHFSEAPVSRRTGPRAELAHYAARIRTATEREDTEGERKACIALARALVTRGTELDTATRLARRALLLGHDANLREELSNWFAALGEPGLAAAALRPLVADLTGPAAARVLTRIGVFLGRAGDAAGAADALFDAAREDPADAAAPELQAGIGAWAPNAVSPERAAEGYLEGFRRREAMGDRAGAFEDLLRAFEMAPGEPAPAERLAGTLSVRGRTAAADEVLREHARASGERGRSVHLRRLREALTAGDVPRALGAAFDAHLEAEGESATVVLGGLFERAGLYELVAARSELALAELYGSERARARNALAELYAGPLASPDRAVDCWIDACISAPREPEARARLEQELDSTGDAAPLVSAFLSITLHGADSDRLQGAIALAELAETRLRDPGLALWAAERAVSLGAGAELADLAARVRAGAEAQDRRIAELASDGGPADPVERASELAGILRGRPERMDEYLAVLAELAAAPGEHNRWQRALERALRRAGRMEELERVLEAALSRTEGAERDRVALALSALYRARGDERRALAVLEPLVGAPGTHAALCAFVLVLAARREEERLWARAIARLAAPMSSSVRAVMLAVAAEALLSSGDVDAAREAAEQATRADPSQARPVGVLATIALARPPDREVAEALERAMGFIVPRAQLCEALAVAHEKLGDPALALVFTQRWLTLRPGDPHAIRTLLGRVTESGDAQRIGDALSWLLSQPEPLSDLAPSLAAALLRLSELDPARGATMARRALDVLGPKSEELRSAVLAVADANQEPGLALALFERTLAVGAESSSRVSMLLELALRRRTVGDADGVARALAHAVAEGASGAEVLALLGDAPPARSSDGELSLLEARAEALAKIDDADVEMKTRAYRDLGAARWDLAGDTHGALLAWRRASELDPLHGPQRLARDLVSFAGYSEALKYLEQMAAGQAESRERSRFLGVASTVALGAGETREALRFAVEALELDASHADVLAVAERAASGDDLDTLERLYEKLSDAALGSYGERAVHYRAARQFERRGEVSRALDHALRAFQAVPAEGVTFVLMGRLAERAGRGRDVVQTLSKVAESVRNPDVRAGWLKRAAAFGGGDEESTRLRVDVLLRALSVRPEPPLLLSLGQALRELGRANPEYRDIGTLRFERALAALLPRLEGPDGARTALAAASVALDLELGGLAVQALERAIVCDADVEWYGELVERAAELGRQREACAALLRHILERSADKYGNVGRHLLELGAHIARSVDDGNTAARLLVAAAERDPDDTDLGRRAALAAELAGDETLTGRIAAHVPTSERIGSLLEAAAQAEKAGDSVLAIEALERVEHEPAAAAEARRRARTRLRELYGLTGNHDKLEELLEAEITSGELGGAALARAGRDLAALLATRGKLERSLIALERTLGSVPDDLGLLEDLATLANQARDQRRRAFALAKLCDLLNDRAKARYLRELGPLLEEMGDDDGATSRFVELSALEPNDVEALAALERAAEKRGDYERAVALLARRAALATRVDDVRRVRLRRATLLEERLGRADEARNELEALLAATGDHLSVLRVLADLHERLGAPLRAAPLWMRASAVTTDRSEAADLLRRACEAFLVGGDVDGARRVLEGMEAWAASSELVELAVEVERRGDDHRALAQALEELAVTVRDSKRQVALWVEAARAHDRAGFPHDALAAAERAAELAPTSGTPQILARWLEYRVRGPTTREQARLAVARLRAVDDALTRSEAELRGFLIAEALDSAVGTGAGMRELMKLSAELGESPLISLGVAERLSEGGEHEKSLAFFERALAGDLQGVRNRGRVAILAADAAREVGDFARAFDFVGLAATEPVSREAALSLANQLRSEQLALEIARERASERRDAPLVKRTDTDPSFPGIEPVPHTQPLPAVVKTPSAVPRKPSSPALERPASVVPQKPPSAAPDRSAFERPPSPEPVAPERPASAAPEKPMSAAPPSVERSLPGAARGAPSARPDTTYRSAAPPDHVLTPDAPAVAPKSARPSPGAVPTPVIQSKPSEAPPPVEARVDMPPASLRRVSGTFPAASAMEAELLDRLVKGSLDAGLELVRQLENRRSRSHDLVAVCRRIAALAPGDRELLRQLYVAALADKNHVYARAVEHVLSLYDPGVDAAPPPNLNEQPEDPVRLRSLLFRDLASPVIEALSLVWESASHVFRRDMAAYGVTGLERIQLNAPTPLAKTYTGAARILGLTRTPLFQRRTSGSITLGVALLTPPAVIVSGDVSRETSELRYHIGAMLVAALPEHVLLFGSNEEQARSILKGMLLAFGPPEEHRAEGAQAASLAEVLWERVPARAQRRLREICHEPGGIDYETAMDAARRAARRAGLFVSGDLAVALRQTCRQEGLPVEAVLAPGSLAKLVAESPAIADLVRLATSSEYAAARWQSTRASKPMGAS